MNNIKESLGDNIMDKNYADLIRQKTDYKQQRNDRYKVDSKDRLATIIKKKIETTMIGALSTIEEHFGFLWNNEDGSALTEEQTIMKELYQSVRSGILDKGNNQARNIDAELAQYEVEWLKYTIEMPMIQDKQEGQ